MAEQHLDNETGEKNLREVYFAITTDAETGEPKVEEVFRRKTFHVPVKYLQPQQDNRNRKARARRKTIKECYFRRKQQIRSNVVKEIIVCTRTSVGPIVFMLPTFFICPGWASLLCLLGEACMHIWSHKRNRRKKNAEVEYRSPLHLISSQFCIHCRSQKWKEKISQIQDKRTLRRRIIYSNFFRRVVE